MTIEWHEFDSRERASTALADHVAELLRADIEATGRAALAVPGGTTPTSFFRALRGLAVAWDRVIVTLTDERWVPPTHDASNARLVQRELLRGPAAAARLVGLYRAVPHPKEALDEIEQALAALPERLTVAVLGMGTDAHTASLFPQAPELSTSGTVSSAERQPGVTVGARSDVNSDGDQMCATPGGGKSASAADDRSHGATSGAGRRHVAAAEGPPPATMRVTLTPARLLASGEIVILVFGREKRAVLERAQRASPAEMPIGLFLQQPVRIYWAP